MLEQEILSKKDHEVETALSTTPAKHWAVPKEPQEDLRQRRLMLAALVLLLVALGGVLWREQDFWFPGNAQQAQDSDTSIGSTANATPATTVPSATKSAPPVAAKPKHHAVSNPPAAPAKPADNSNASAGPKPETTVRTVLPPLEVEVVAGDTHRTLRPGTNSVRVDLQQGAPAQVASEPTTETAAKVTSDAAERVHMSADTNEVVTHSVKPGYPMLARQMKVQGSVILRALIGKDGIIQDLHIVSGPSILAAAAENAVRQWRFKPHYVGSDAVETQANITVNFTISTN